MLVAKPAGVAFRHELARLAVEASVPPHRKLGLHRAALAALAEPPVGAPDLARLAHHAEAAGDADAVLRFAPAAAARAASTGAYREAAAQDARALRFGDRLPPDRRAELLERRSHACYLTDQNDAAVEAIQEALECRRQLGQRLEEGDALRWRSQVLWCPGRTAEAEQAAREAVKLLEALPPGRELAMAYANLAATCSAAARPEEAVGWAGRALELAERLDDTEIAVHARTTVATCELGEQGWRKLEQSLELARRGGLIEQVARAYLLLVERAVGSRRHGHATRHLQAGIDYCSDHGLELQRLYLLAYRAERWRELGCPYEAALALADAREEAPLRRALDELQRLGARPAAAIVARRLREGGALRLPRGPRPATRRNPAGLTPRELEVLALLAGGLRYADIAARLVLSERTVGHHVGAILRRLGVHTRGEASAEAARLGLTGQDG
jgi:DNA-binding CsgD family transcriptional regulator